MQNPTTGIQEMIQELNRFQLPGSLMESFDTWREEAVGVASREFRPSQLSWFLDLLNRFRGPEDRKESLLEVFDPGMYSSNHPAWETPPGTTIELPALTSEVARTGGEDSEFAEIARGEIGDFSQLAATFADEEILGLAKIARAALVDRSKSFCGREDAIQYLALNASARLEDLWALNDSFWVKAPPRQIEFEDMVAKRQSELRQREGNRPALEEKDFACYTEDEIRAFAFDMRKLFLTERVRHLSICSPCRRRLEHWSQSVEGRGGSTSLDKGADA
jgi:hypothetical protein